MSTTNDAATASPVAQEPVKEKEWVELRPPVRDTDFKENYPPDRKLGHELADTARVWKVYRGEAIDHDDALLKTWNETVNILLTFAGLFSAAVTSFVVASTDDLKPDPNAYVANLLFTMGNANGGSTSPFAHLPAPPPLEAAPSALARVVNGLWFTSLFLSLAAALLCILVKQWLDEYTARTRGSVKHPRQWAQRRSFYFQGLADWNVAAIISFLPLFLHLALFLFLAGLIVFLWDLDSVIRWVLLLLMLLLLALYIVSLAVPVWSAACPYATPLLAQLRNFGYTALITVYMLRTRTLPGMIMIRRLIHHIFSRLPCASRQVNFETFVGEVITPDPRIKHLLEQRSRRPFERVLHKIKNTESRTVILYREWGDFEARLDCSSLQWLMHNVSDSDAVAVAWQSLGALLEEPASLRFTRMGTILPGLVEYAGGNETLWRTLRMEGTLDDMQIARIARSALFVASSMASDLHDILYFGVPFPDDVYLHHTTLFPDAALISAYSHPHVPAHQAVQAVVNRLHEHGTHRPLPSTVNFLISQLVPHPFDFKPPGPEAAIGLLHYCNLHGLSGTAWNHVARVLDQSCTGGDANPLHECGAYCVVNALCLRALHLSEDETSSSLNPRQASAAPFDADSHVQLVIRIISNVSGSFAGHADFSAAVWTVLTDTRYLSRRTKREDRIRAVSWAQALFRLAESSNKFYALFSTQYNLTWSRLLRGFVRNHPKAILDEGIDFAGDADSALVLLVNAWKYVTPWQIETVTDPALRHARLLSALKLAESGGVAFCSVDLDSGVLRSIFREFVDGVPLWAFFPTDLGLKEGEHNEWVELFVSAVQHFVVLDLLPWNSLRDAVAASNRDDFKTFFHEVRANLMEIGPCKRGDCADKAPADPDWRFEGLED